MSQTTPPTNPAPGRDRALTALIATAFLGATNVNLLRAALVVLATTSLPASQAAMVALAAAGLLMLPYLMVSGLAGRLADRLEKTRLLRLTKGAEAAVTLIAVLALLSENLPLLVLVVFLLGLQSAFYSPVKQGWLPERLPPSALLGANALLELATFAAILIGTLSGGLAMALGGGAAVGAMAGVLAVLGLLASLRLPVGQPAAPGLRVPANPFAGNLALLGELAAQRPLWHASLLDAWFWAAGAVYLSALPVYLGGRLGADGTLIPVVMALFAAGIGAGAMGIARLLRGRAVLWTTAPSALGLTLAGAVLCLALPHLQGGGTAALFATPAGLVTSLATAAIAMAGGSFSVPLSAMVQAASPAASRARIQAAKGVLSAAAIALLSLALSALTAAGLPLAAPFWALAMGSLAVSAATIRFFPAEALQALIRFLMLPLRIRVRGAEHLDSPGPVIFISNHQSLLDGPLLFSLIGPGAAFAVTRIWAEGPLLSRVSGVVPILATDHDRPMSIKAMARRITAGQSCVIFPEGRITTTGALMKVYGGTAWLVDQARVPVIPIHIEGSELSRLARAKPGHRLRWFPRLTVTVGPPRPLDLPEGLKGRARRDRAALMVTDMLEEQRFRALDRHDSLPQALAEIMALHGRGRLAISDPTTRLTHARLHIGADALARHLPRHLTGRSVGLLLPSAAGVPVLLLALWRLGITPALLNPTLGAGPMKSCLATAGVDTVLTSAAMAGQLRLGPLLDDLRASGFTLLTVEDLRATLPAGDKVRAVLSARFGAASRGAARRHDITRDTPAAILFTSGTEGAPKGVALSHGNLLANVAQIRARTDINPGDRIFSALPVFHSFGLTGGMLVPLVTGAEVTVYPSPLHYRAIPELAYHQQPSIIFGTDSFLSGWGRRAHPYDFASLRAAIAGAEQVRPATRRLWSDRFGVRILEGYGATETAPVLSLNTPMQARDGTVGRLLPGMTARLTPIEGVDAQRLSVQGPNVMLGYIRPETPGRIEPLPDGWYDTGDAVTIDAEGFITIAGRIKRFAKVGGEMVSLAAVEGLATRTWPEVPAAALSLPDPRRGNRVVLALAPKFGPPPRMDHLRDQARREGLAEILLPAELRILPALPLLASGKPDYPALTKQLTEGTPQD